MTDKALERKAVRPLEVELTLPEGAELVAGERKTEAGQLQGRVHRRSVLWWGGDDSTADLTKLEWVIEAPDGRRARDRGAAPAGGHRPPGCVAGRERLGFRGVSPTSGVIGEAWGVYKTHWRHLLTLFVRHVSAWSRCSTALLAAILTWVGAI